MGQWQSQPVCTTPSCIHAASFVLKNLAPDWKKMDPCTDFDKMVCYGTFEHHGENGGTIDDVMSRNRNILRKILDSPNHETAAGIKSTMLQARGNTEEFNFDMLRTQYQACMNTTTRAAADISPLTDIIVSINRTWTVSPSDLGTPVGTADLDEMHQAALSLEQMGVPIFHSLCGGDDPLLPDFTNSKLNRICYGPPRLPEPDFDNYVDPDFMEDYTETMQDIFQLVYPSIDEETAAGLAEAVSAFETDIARTAIPFAEAAVNLGAYDTMKNATLADIGKSAPELGLDKLIAALTPKGQTPSVILLDEPEFWPKFSKLITRHSKAAVHGYMMWQAINKLAPIVDSPDLHDLLDITPGNGREQWDLCIDAAGLSVGHILNSYFVKATYPDLTLKAADKMTTNVRNAFVKRLGELDWMSPDSKKRAIKKAENIVQNIGYPTEKPDLRSAESLASYYTGMNITNDHFSNMLSARAHKMAKGYAEVANPPDRNIFGEINIVNAFYAPWLNTITIPAGISQLPFFHHHLPLYALYGGLGSVVGHEISHGFDDEGRLWSEDHELETWWDNSTVENFEKGAQCFVDQYSKFEVETPSGMLTVDGENTLGENLADAGGLRASFNAWNEERGKMPGVWDQSLPGLEGFTHEQLFFIFYGNSWCEAPSKQLNAMSVDPRRAHSPSLIRIKGSAENSAAFQEAFKCKSKPKCELF